MITIAHYVKPIVAATAVLLAAVIAAGPANAAGPAYEPPDPCVAAACKPIHAALNPQPLPPGRARIVA